MAKKRGRRSDDTGRSVGEPKHVRLYRWMMQSEAWRHLSLRARCLLIELYDLYNGANNGELFMSVRDAARRLAVSKNTAVRLFHELGDKGFIRARQRGSFAWKARHATSWILTEFGYAGQTPTKEFMRWRDERQFQNAVLAGGTNGTQSRHRASSQKPENGTHGPSHGYQQDRLSPSHGPRQRDTDSLPGGGCL